jgi:methylmalonyl-CoA mutase
MNALFEEFSASSAADWKDRLSKDLKGITFEDLCLIDRNDITIHPFYTDEGEHKESIFIHKDWSICASIKDIDPKKANKKALNELQNGASGLCFEISETLDLTVLLNEIQLPYIYTQFKITSDIKTFVGQFKQYLAAQNRSIADLDCCVVFDPIAKYINGNEWEKDQSKIDFLEIFLQTKCISIDASSYQNAGANSSYQLACTTAQLNEYLHWLDLSGNIASLQKVNISLVTGTDFFEEIAKLRALKILTANLLTQYNISPTIQLHIETSDTYRSAFDSYSNLLRDSIAGMAAVLGGCNSLLIHAFDQSLNDANEFSSRMSRNQQLIFKEESYLSQIADASAGSFYIEKLTEQITDKAWTSFQQIEKEGGLIASFEKGIIKKTVEIQAAQWIQEYKDGKRVLIGVNKYVNAKDEPKASSKKIEAGKGLKLISLTEELIDTNE